MISEDFSFPKITNPLPHFAISPSLWRVSSVVYPDFCNEGDDEIETKSLYMSSLKFEEDAVLVKKGSNTGSTHEEEKMDMLWEDFNEELERVSSLGKKKQSLPSNNRLNGERGGGEEELQLCCVLALKMSKPDSKKQSLVSVVKVLKKIFSLHKSTQMKKK